MDVSIRLHSSTASQDSCLFIRLVRLVIPIEWYRRKLFVLSNCPYQNRPWIAHVRTEHLSAYNQHRNASAPAKPEINFRVCCKSILHRHKTPSQLLLNLCRIHYPLRNFSLIKRILNRLLYVKSELCLYKLRYFLTKHTMTIANCKKVSPAILAKMRQDEVGVLVSFSWIFRAESGLGSEAKLSHTVVKLFRCWIVGLPLLTAWLGLVDLFSGGYFSCNWGTKWIIPFSGVFLLLMHWSAVRLLSIVIRFTVVNRRKIWVLIGQIRGWAGTCQA